MNIIEKLISYDFTNFKQKNCDPDEKYISRVMKEVERGGNNHHLLKEKIDKELRVTGKNRRGIYYPTMIKYLALALMEIESTKE